MCSSEVAASVRGTHRCRQLPTSTRNFPLEFTQASLTATPSWEIVGSPFTRDNMVNNGRIDGSINDICRRRVAAPPGVREPGHRS